MNVISLPTRATSIKELYRDKKKKKSKCKDEYHGYGNHITFRQSKEAASTIEPFKQKIVTSYNSCLENLSILKLKYTANNLPHREDLQRDTHNVKNKRAVIFI